MIQTIISDSAYDFKYQKIFENINYINVVDGPFKNLLFSIIKSEKPIFHIRYFKVKGFFFGIPRYLVLLFLTLIKGGKILYSCHNLREHNVKNKFLNDFYRFIFSLLAFRIIYFHEKVRKKNFKIFYNKGVIANFGSFEDFFKKNKKESSNFINHYKVWSKNRNIDIISISAAKFTSDNKFFDLIKDIKYNSVQIKPTETFRDPFISENQFRFYDFVYSSIPNILKINKKIIGFIGHNNCSVSTSLYMFASFGIPVIAYNFSPNSQIVKNNNIGVVVPVDSDVRTIINYVILIKNNYSDYSKNCFKFIKNNSWAKSAQIHKNIIF